MWLTVYNDTTVRKVVVEGGGGSCEMSWYVPLLRLMMWTFGNMYCHQLLCNICFSSDVNNPDVLLCCAPCLVCLRWLYILICQYARYARWVCVCVFACARDLNLLFKNWHLAMYLKLHQLLEWFSGQTLWRSKPGYIHYYYNYYYY